MARSMVRQGLQQPGYVGFLQPCYVGRDAFPPAIAKVPDIGVPARAFRAVVFLVAGPSVDDREIAENSDQNVMLPNVPYR